MNESKRMRETLSPAGVALEGYDGVHEELGSRSTKHSITTEHRKVDIDAVSTSSTDDFKSNADIPIETDVVDPNATETAEELVANARVSNSDEDRPYTIFPEWQKRCIMIMVSFAGLVSPLSSNIYFPVLNDLAKDLHVSISLINLTVTTYLICQGIAPSFTANSSDVYGRRPVYLFCFTVYVAACIGLALQDSYGALMVLRCLQSTGSSATIALSNGVVSDISTRAERGKYIAYATMGTVLGPSLGPVIGGLIGHYLGWRAIFWFLVILSGTFGLFIAIVLPETCRTIVGNGSVPPPKLNQSGWQVFRSKFWPRKEKTEADYESIQPGRRRPNPLASAFIATEKEAFVILIFSSLLFGGYQAVLSTLTSQLKSRFGFSSVQIGLCYLPLGLGSMTSRWTVGRLMDYNFKREARSQGLSIHENRQQKIEEFNIEKTRLTITLPLIYVSSLCIITYGWVMEYRTVLAGPLVMLFFIGNLTTGAFLTLNTLIVDTHRKTPATAVAANNLFRCLTGAGAVAVANPLIQRIGIGWTATFIAGLWIVFSPCLWAVYKWGFQWRVETEKDNERKKLDRERKKALNDPEAGEK